MFQSDAGRPARTRPLRCSSVAPGISKAKAPTKGLSTLNSMAFGLAVYASPCGSPQHDARLASGRWSGATGRAFHPQGSYERFQIRFLTSRPPFPSFAWHNEIDLGTFVALQRRSMKPTLQVPAADAFGFTSTHRSVTMAVGFDVFCFFLGAASCLLTVVCHLCNEISIAHCDHSHRRFVLLRLPVCPRRIDAIRSRVAESDAYA